MNEFVAPPRVSKKVLVFSVLGLAAFLAVEALLLRHFVRVDTRPPSWDQATHLEIALDYREALGAGRWGDMWYLAPKPGMPPFPPLYHLLLRGAYDSSDPAHAALWVNWFYMAVLAVSLFGISWRFLPDSRALAATIAFCASPGLQDLLTNQLVDLSLVAWAAAAYWALLASEGFTVWLPSLAFGVLHAVGMMHKWSFFSYMLPAYLIAGRALGDKRALPRVLAAAALSAALSAPWYWAHLALLPSRLVQASSDFAKPFWKDYAWADYLIQSSASLGPVLWALGFISLLTPQYSRRREQAWILGYWVLFSYLFWMVVPNRQIRFLLPGLVPVGTAMAATWPSSVTWSVAALQLAGALNFFFGVLGPIRINAPLVTLTFFDNRPPAAEDWKTDEILKRIEADRDASRAITNVTLIANDAYFNAPTFHWAQRRLNLPHARMRGVNARLCELSEFVLLKKGKLGPAGVIGGLPEAQKVVEEDAGWFSRAFDEDARWPLPDGSVAVLYRLKRGRSSPFAKPRADYQFFEAGQVQVQNLRVEFGPWDKSVSAWKTASVGAQSVSIRGLIVRAVDADLTNFSFVPLFEGTGVTYDYNDLRLTRLDAVSVKGLDVSADDLKVFLEKRVHGLKVDALTLDGTVKASGSLNGKPVSAEAALDLDRAARRLRVRVISASYMGLSMPAAMFRPIKELDISLEPNPETPFAVDLPSITIRGGRLSVP